MAYALSAGAKSLSGAREENPCFGGTIYFGNDTMNNYERFSKQMNLAFDLLQRTISEFDLPLFQRDKFSGLVRDLMEYSYQTGRAEGLGGLHGQEAGFHYMKEFGSSIKVEPQVLNLVLDGLMEDRSWHNNAAAHFERVMSDGKILLLWIAEEDPKEREGELVPRYAVDLAGREGTTDVIKQELLATEKTNEACTFVRERIEEDLRFSRNGKIHFTDGGRRSLSR